MLRPLVHKEGPPVGVLAGVVATPTAKSSTAGRQARGARQGGRVGDGRRVILFCGKRVYNKIVKSCNSIFLR